MKVRWRSSYLPVLCSLSAICFAFPSFEVGGTCLRPREYFKAILWVTIILQLGQCFVRTKKYVVFLLIHVIFLSFQSAYIKCCIKFLILSSLPNSIILKHLQVVALQRKYDLFAQLPRDFSDATDATRHDGWLQCKSL